MQDFNRENNSLETDRIEDYANAIDKIDGKIFKFVFKFIKYFTI